MKSRFIRECDGSPSNWCPDAGYSFKDTLPHRLAKIVDDGLTLLDTRVIVFLPDRDEQEASSAWGQSRAEVASRIEGDRRSETAGLRCGMNVPSAAASATDPAARPANDAHAVGGHALLDEQPPRRVSVAQHLQIGQLRLVGDGIADCPRDAERIHSQGRVAFGRQHATVVALTSVSPTAGAVRKDEGCSRTPLRQPQHSGQTSPKRGRRHLESARRWRIRPPADRRPAQKGYGAAQAHATTAPSERRNTTEVERHIAPRDVLEPTG